MRCLLLCVLLTLTSGAAGACTSQNGLPDPVCTPGSLDPAVTAANLHETVCVRGYSSRVRPPLKVSAPLKREVIRRYGLPVPPRLYEGDHLIPLSLGGCPGPGRACDFLANYIPLRWRGIHNARDKDRIGWTLSRRVCSGKLSLDEAQRRIATDWRHALDGLEAP